MSGLSKRKQSNAGFAHKPRMPKSTMKMSVDDLVKPVRVATINDDETDERHDDPIARRSSVCSSVAHNRKIDGATYSCEDLTSVIPHYVSRSRAVSPTALTNLAPLAMIHPMKTGAALDAFRASMSERGDFSRQLSHTSSVNDEPVKIAPYSFNKLNTSDLYAQLITSDSPLAFVRQHPQILECAEAENDDLYGRESVVVSSIVEAIYNLFKFPDRDRFDVSRFYAALRQSGIQRLDPRLSHLQDELVKQGMASKKDSVRVYDATQTVCFPPSMSHDNNLDEQRLGELSRETVDAVLRESIVLITRAIHNQLVIPEWELYVHQITDIVHATESIKTGHVASYIPQLARVNPEYYGVAVCSIDGQRHSWGNAKTQFCIQSLSKPFTYALALNELGADTVHTFVGTEPSGRLFNEITLDYNNKPHNPMVNAGAIVTASLLKPKWPSADRFDYMIKKFQAIGGNEFIGFSNTTFLSEHDTADRNYALAYYMREHQCFPEGTRIDDALSFYFQVCSLEINCESGAVMAATLANGGICPTTGERVLSNDACRHTLSLMYSCGMYDYSGMFAFKVGLPAKSGVSGCMILVVPNVCGFCIFSPPLDKLGNTVRGVKFCEELVEVFAFHNYDNLLHGDNQRRDPRRRQVESQQERLVQVLFAAKYGDLQAVQNYHQQGVDLEATDYDGRTALHVAAAEGHIAVVQFIIDNSRTCITAKDRWGRTPLDDAKEFAHEEVIELLTRQMKDPNAADVAPHE